MPDAELNLHLKLIDETKRALNQIKQNFSTAQASLDKPFSRLRTNIEKAKVQLKSFAQTVRQNWLQITAAITASIFALRTAFRIFEDAARFEQQQQAFRNLAAANNADADKMIRKLKEMSAQTLSTAQVMQQASKAMVLGLQPDQLPRLMEISRAAARAFGEDVDFMFESIVLGIGRQSRMILDNLGIIVRSEEAYEEYAQTLGKNVKELTDMQKRQAFANAVMKQGARIIGDVNIQMKSQLENLQTLKAFWADLRITIGNVLLFIIRAFSAMFNFVMAGVQQIVSGILQMVETILIGVEKMVIGLDNVLSLLPKIENPLEGIRQNIEETKRSTSEWGELTAGLSLDYTATGDAILQMMMATDQAVASSAKLRDAVAKVKAEAESLKVKFKEIVKDIGNSIADSIGSAFADMIVEGKNFADSMVSAFKNMAKQFIAAVASMIAKWLAFMALRKLFGGFGFFHQGGMVFHKGGEIPRAHSGLAVDEVPIIAQTGEGILSRRGMAALGGAGELNRLNAGEPAGGSRIEITINNPVIRDDTDIRSLSDALGTEIERQLRYART